MSQSWNDTSFKKRIAIVITGLALAKATELIIKSVQCKIVERKMQQIALRKRQIRDQIIENFQLPELTIPDQLVQEILIADIKSIKQMLFSKKISVHQLTILYIKRCIEIAYPLNLLADVNFELALELAKIQDIQIQLDPNVLLKKGNELYGIPVSVKEFFIIKGFDSTVGLASKCFKPYNYDGIQVALIKKAGGIIFATTNVPQLGMTFESVNHIYGRALNPWDQSRSVGGSSGGEAALMAARCSVIGIGSDIGGSIRIPSSFCGVFGLKPSMGRQTVYGEFELSKATGGLTNLQGSKGPIGRNINDLAIMFKVIFNEEYYNELDHITKDHHWSPRNWDDQKYQDKKKLRIGKWQGIDLLKPAICMIRGVSIAEQALINEGHEVVEFKVPQDLIEQIASMFLRILSSEGQLRSFLDQSGGEKVIKEYELMFQSLLIPSSLNNVIKPILKILGQKRLGFIMESNNELNGYDLLCLFQQHFELQKKFINLWIEQDLDGIICPAFAVPAIKHGYSEQVSLSAIYTWLFNVLNLPAGVLPVSIVLQDEQFYQDNSDFIAKSLNQSMQNSAGLPVNVQVVTLPNQEELCLRIMKEIDQNVQFYKNNSYPI